MDKPGNMAQLISFARAGGLSILLLFVALATVVVGVLVSARPAWTNRRDIRAYNEGVISFNMPPGPLPATNERPAEYPIERAAAFWKVASETSDAKLKSLVLYNLGTLIGRESWAFRMVNNPRNDMTQASLWLAEAVRDDPSNEAAKYNLELVEKVQTPEGEKVGAPGPGYAPGAVGGKGY